MLKKGPLNVLICYVLWGILPLFWGLLGDLSALGVLGYRILFSLLLVGGYLLLTGQWPQVRKVLGNRKEMRRLAASGLVIAVNWGSFIWAVNSGHVLDSSLAYYMYPILSIFIGAVFFREKLGLLQWAAVVLMTAGVAVTAVGQGVFPWLALVIGGSFVLYGVIKRRVTCWDGDGPAVRNHKERPYACNYRLCPGPQAQRAGGAGDPPHHGPGKGEHVQYLTV